MYMYMYSNAMYKYMIFGGGRESSVVYRMALHE